MMIVFSSLSLVWHTFHRVAVCFRILLAVILNAVIGVPSSPKIANASAETNSVLRVGISADYPPMEYIKDGQIIGHDIDLMDAVAAKIGAQLTYVNIDFDQLFQSLTSDAVDIVISSVTVTSERVAQFDFTLPYVIFNGNEQIAIVTKKGENGLLHQLNEALWQLRADGTLLANVQAIQMDFASQNPQMPTWPEISTGSPIMLSFDAGAISVSAPAGAVSQPTVLTFRPSGPATQTGSFFYAGRSFQLDGYENGAYIDGLIFQAPVKITVHYDDSGFTSDEEQSLQLRLWNEESALWTDAAATCAPLSVYQHNLSENWLSVDICHLSWYALFGSDRVFLPAIWH